VGGGLGEAKRVKHLEIKNVHSSLPYPGKKTLREDQCKRILDGSIKSRGRAKGTLGTWMTFQRETPLEKTLAPSREAPDRKEK